MTVLEYFQVEAMRRAFFEQHGLPVQRRSDEARWYIARDGDRVLGCYSVQDVPALGQRWALDFYGRGTALRALARHLYAQADEDGFDVLFHVLPWAERWRAMLLELGLEERGVLMGGRPQFGAKMRSGGPR